MPQDVADLRRNLLFPDEPRADRIIDVVVDVGDLVGEADRLALERVRMARGAVIQDTVAHLLCEVQTPAVLFQHLDDTDTLLDVRESLMAEAVQHMLAAVSERGMAEIMAEGDGLDEVLVQAKCLAEGTGNLADLQGVREARTVVVSLRCDEDLRFMLEAAEGLTVDDTVTITLEARAYVVRLLRTVSSLRFRGECRIRRQGLPLQRFQFFSDTAHLASDLMQQPNDCLLLEYHFRRSESMNIPACMYDYTKRKTRKPCLRVSPKGSRCDWIRTSDLCVPNAALYQAEPRIDMLFSLLCFVCLSNR